MRMYGRLPPDPARLALAPSLAEHTFSMMLPPAKLDRSALGFKPLMADNDHYPDCTGASLFNHARINAKLLGFELVCDEKMVLPFYAKCIGQPDDPIILAASQGAQALDVVSTMAKDGFDIGRSVGSEPNIYVGKFFTIPIQKSTLALTVDRCALWCGVNLYEADESGPWNTIGSKKGKLVGGHQINIFDFPEGLDDGDTITVQTWDSPIEATWGWLMDRIDEAYGIIWPQLEKPNDQSWLGISMAQLDADMRQFGIAV